MPDMALGATALLRLSATSEEKRKEMMAWSCRGWVEQVVVDTDKRDEQVSRDSYGL
jgi:hypothetical protein